MATATSPRSCSSSAPTTCSSSSPSRRSPQHLASVLDHADRVGARIILITDTLHSHGVTPTLVLAAPRGHQEGFASLTVPMTVTNAVVLTMAARHSDTILPALDRLDGLLETLDE
ncbi:hypothetical protein QP028_01460 [Corynebacterium suedekumii]|nr:hypothetical protein QP028_01460 [Corynebacterium suedekumii]